MNGASVKLEKSVLLEVVGNDDHVCWKSSGHDMKAQNREQQILIGVNSVFLCANPMWIDFYSEVLVVFSDILNHVSLYFLMALARIRRALQVSGVSQ